MPWPSCRKRRTHHGAFVHAEKRITLDHVRQHPFFWKHEKIGAEAVTVEENESGEEGTVEWSDSMDVMTC